MIYNQDILANKQAKIANEIGWKLNEGLQMEKKNLVSVKNLQKPSALWQFISQDSQVFSLWQTIKTSWGGCLSRDLLWKSSVATPICYMFSADAHFHIHFLTWGALVLLLPQHTIWDHTTS